MGVPTRPRRCAWQRVVCAAALMGIALAQPAAAADARRVVLLYDERTDLPGLAALDSGLVESLSSDPAGPIEIYREAMDLSRLGSETYLRLLRDYLRAKYAAKRIDAVVAAMGPSLDFLLNEGAPVFPGTPIIFCGVDRREIEGLALPAHVTGVLLKREFAPTLEVVLQLHPDTTRIVFVAGTSEFDRRLVEQARAEFSGQEKRLAFTYLTTLSLQDVLDQVANLPPQTIVLYSTMFRDGAGGAFVPHEAAQRIAAAANVPVYGFLDQFMGRGIVGGHLYSLDAHAKQAAELVREVLAGAQPSDTPLREGGASVYRFDWRQLRRWGIDEGRLPAGSVVLFKETGAWETYKPQIIGTFLFLLLQTAFIAGLLLQRAHRIRVEQALRESEQRLTMATAAGAAGIWDWNIEASEMYVDPMLKSILGFEDEEITTRPEDWGSRIHPRDAPMAMAQLQLCLDGEGDFYESEHRVLHKDGSVLWFLSRGSLMRRANGTPYRMLGTDTDITDRKRADETVREANAILRENEREIENLTGRLIAAQEAERARIARDLHDDISQQLAGLGIALSGLKRRLTALPESAEAQVMTIGIQARTISLARNVRDLSHSLHPSTLEHVGLVTALAAYCREVQVQETLAVRFTSEGNFESTDPQVALCLYRIAQEALQNVVKHAEAQHANVRLRLTGTGTELTIEDDGTGFASQTTRTSKGGLGLVSIQERARSTGGTATITTEMDKGTRVFVQVPSTRPVQSAAGYESAVGV